VQVLRKLVFFIAPASVSPSILAYICKSRKNEGDQNTYFTKCVDPGQLQAKLRRQNKTLPRPTEKRIATIDGANVKRGCCCLLQHQNPFKGQQPEVLA